MQLAGFSKTRRYEYGFAVCRPVLQGSRTDVLVLPQPFTQLHRYLRDVFEHEVALFHAIHLREQQICCDHEYSAAYDTIYAVHLDLRDF